MFLDKKCVLLATTLMTAAAFAQQPTATPAGPKGVHTLDQPNQTVTYTSAADMAALIDRAKKESADDSTMVVGKILQLAPYTVLLDIVLQAKMEKKCAFLPEFTPRTPSCSMSLMAQVPS